MHVHIFANIYSKDKAVTVFKAKILYLQEWAEELFNLASNLLVQNTSREACLEKAYVIATHTFMHESLKVYLHESKDEYANQGCYIMFVLDFMEMATAGKFALF